VIRGRWRQDDGRGYQDHVPRKPERPGERVAADLRRRIAAGEWDHDEPLPPVAELAESYGVGKATITRVLRILAEEDLVRVVPRWGTFRI
jgi:DNA-binding GntR family transcriptional regulator